MIKIIVGVLFGIAFYFILADAFKVPYMRTSKAITNLAKQHQEKTSSIDVWLGGFAGAIAKHIPMNEFKRIELETDLRTAQMNITPEMFMANAIVKALIIGVFAVPLYFIFPILCPVVIFLAFVLYRINMKSVGGKIKEKRAKIEYELPRLVANIEKTLKHERSLLSILTEYSRNAGPELKHELDITIADMNSGNQEAAITRLEARVGSSMMSDVCRGFIGMIRGDSNPVYWSSLAMKFSDIHRQRLRLEAQKIPRKVKKLSMSLLFCFMLIYVVVIIAQIMGSVGVLFG